MTTLYQDYCDLILSFIEGKLPAGEFQTVYSKKYLNDNTEHKEDVFDILESIFYYADCFVEIPELRTDETDLDEDGLRSKVATLFQELKEYAKLEL